MKRKARQNALSNLELATFCEQIAMVLRAGISVAEGISIIKEDAQTEAEKELLTSIYYEIQETGEFAKALEDTGVFPRYLCKMAKIGEETGTLDEMFASLARYYERQEALAASIRSALAYPLVMIGTMAFVTIVLLTKVMPVFEQVFEQLGMEMSGLSKGALLLGEVFSGYAAVFVGSAAILAIGLFLIVKTKTGRKKLENLGRRFGLSRDISDQIAICRFAGGMSLALRSGLTPERGLELAEELNENRFLERKINSCKKLMEEGRSMEQAFRETEIFTGIHARLTDIAGRTGAMDEAMEKLSDRMEEAVDKRITSLAAMLEPTLVALLSVITGTILFSVMLPLLGILADL